MGTSKLRWSLTVLLGGISAILAIVPLTLWRESRAATIRDDVRNDAIAQMEDVLHGEQSGHRVVDYYSWYTRVSDSTQQAFVESDLLPPVRNWMRDADGTPSFRDYPVEGEAGYLAYVRPIDADAGFVTLVDVADRDRRLTSLVHRYWLLVAGLVVASSGLALAVSGLALGPTRRIVADQQGFLADAAHEMRTPLAVILASSSQALSRPRSSEEYVRSLAEIRSAAERASSGVNEMLDLVRLTTGQAITRLGPLRLDLLAEEVAASARPERGEVIAEPGAPVVVDADMALLRQAIDNLVRNAMRRADRVEVSARVDGRDGVIEVVDNGPGFDPAILPTVFERYQRGDRRGEAGMGLAIVRAIADAHGGTAHAANRECGGASVSIRIPLNQSITLRP